MDLTENYEIIDSRGKQVFLVCAGMCPEEMCIVYIIGIAFASRYVVFRNIECVEVVLDTDDRTQLLVALHSDRSTVNLLPKLFLICSLIMQIG